jgi:hypothetical protein
MPASFEVELAVVAGLLREVGRMEAGENRRSANPSPEGYEQQLRAFPRRAGSRDARMSLPPLDVPPTVKSDYRYTNQIVYNNFPWPEKRGDENLGAVEKAAQGVLNARQIEVKRDPTTSLATLYDPDLMPPSLVKVHETLYRAVDSAYVADGGKRKWESDAERVAFLFRRYRELTSLLPGEEPASRSKALRRRGSGR